MKDYSLTFPSSENNISKRKKYLKYVVDFKQFSFWVLISNIIQSITLVKIPLKINLKIKNCSLTFPPMKWNWKRHIKTKKKKEGRKKKET